jgi:DnaK suppressor protein
VCYFIQTVRRPEEKTPKISDQRLAAYRRLLEQKAEEVRMRLSANRAAEIVHRPEEPLDFGDWCQKSHEEWLFVNRNRLEIELLRELEAALLRLTTSDFGICGECQEPISAKRLDAVPWARFCVPCQERATAAAVG